MKKYIILAVVFAFAGTMGSCFADVTIVNNTNENIKIEPVYDKSNIGPSGMKYSDLDDKGKSFSFKNDQNQQLIGFNIQFTDRHSGTFCILPLKEDNKTYHLIESVFLIKDEPSEGCFPVLKFVPIDESKSK